MVMSLNTFDAIWKIILLTVALVAIWWTVIFLLRRLKASTVIRQEAAHEASGEHKRLRALCNTQGAVIDAFINEMAMRPKTYETMPDDLKNAFYAAHEGARMVETEGNNH